MRTTAFLATLALGSSALADELAPVAAPAPAQAPVAPPAPETAAVTDDNNLLDETPIPNGINYARQGTIEIGANAGMMLAPGFRTISFAPMLGWFVSELIELSAIAGVSNIKAGDSSSTVLSALVEPSYHVPLSGNTFGFIGVGVGVAYASGVGAGVAVTPRIGANVMLGSRSVLTPSLSYEYTTLQPDENEMANITRAALGSSLRINIGYSAMF